ncbi:MAG: hypothetical protein ACSLEI_00805 [Candidatus Carsonella ruddii]
MFLIKYIFLKSGNGGNGCISFKKQKNIFFSNGGNGGNGGNIYIFSNNNFKFFNKNIYIANNGKNGNNNKKKGKNGKDLVIKIPLGSCIIIKFKKYYIIKNNIFLKLLKGGVGGLGNINFKKFFNKKIATFGKKGILKIIKVKYYFFYKKSYINVSNFYFKNNFFNYNNNYISKIYIFYINIFFIKIFFKIIKFYLYFIYIKNLKFSNYWLIIDGIEKIKKIKKIKKINYIIIPYYITSTIFNIGFKKFLHYFKIWKNS